MTLKINIKTIIYLLICKDNVLQVYFVTFSIDLIIILYLKLTLITNK